MLQSDADFLYELRASGATTAVTVQSGSRSGTYVQALQQEFTIPHGALTQPWGQDVSIDVIGATGSGNLNIYWVG